MSMLSFALSTPSHAHFSIEHNDDDCEDGSLCHSDDETTPPHKAYSYMTKDAFLNRATFLIVICLIVVFILCVSRDGANDNIEWLRKQLSIDYISMDKNRRELTGMSNRMPRIVSTSPTTTIAMSSILLVISVSFDTAPVSEVLAHLLPQYNALGFNTSVVIWANSPTVPTLWDDDSVWSIKFMSRHNATSPESLIYYLLEVMQIGGVLYMDANLIQQNLNTGLFYVDIKRLLGLPILLPRVYDMAVMKYRWMPATINATSDPRSDLFNPPSMPLIDESMMVVWNSPATLSLFRDAVEWQHSLALKQDDNGGKGEGTGPFILNMLLNDGRHVIQPGDNHVDSDALSVRFYDGDIP